MLDKETILKFFQAHPFTFVVGFLAGFGISWYVSEELNDKLHQNTKFIEKRIEYLEGENAGIKKLKDRIIELTKFEGQLALEINKHTQCNEQLNSKSKEIQALNSEKHIIDLEVKNCESVLSAQNTEVTELQNLLRDKLFVNPFKGRVIERKVLKAHKLNSLLDDKLLINLLDTVYFEGPAVFKINVMNFRPIKVLIGDHLNITVGDEELTLRVDSFNREAAVTILQRHGSKPTKEVMHPAWSKIKRLEIEYSPKRASDAFNLKKMLSAYIKQIKFDSCKNRCREKRSNLIYYKNNKLAAAIEFEKLMNNNGSYGVFSIEEFPYSASVDLQIHLY